MSALLIFLGLLGLFLIMQVAVYLRLVARAGRLAGLATLDAQRRGE